jgi:nucleoid-associated protein YgaU
MAWGCGGPQPTTQPAGSGPAAPGAVASAAGPEEPEVIDSAAWPGRTHIVQANETLYSLAQLYYGDANQWRRIWSANKRRLSDPKNIPMGMKLIIP